MLTIKEEDYYVNNKGGGLIGKQQRLRTIKLSTKDEDYDVNNKGGGLLC